MSVPIASGTASAATAAAEPPEEPPGTRERSQGFRTGPKAELSFEEPIPNSSQLVFPTTTHPAAFSRATQVASSAATNPARIREPAVEGREADVHVVLHGEGHSRERHRLSRRDSAVDLRRRRHGALRGDVEEGAVEGPAAFGAGERRLRHVPRGHPPLRDGRRQVVRRPVEESVDVRRHPFLETTRGTTKWPCESSGAFEATNGRSPGAPAGSIVAERGGLGLRNGRKGLLGHGPQSLEVLDDPGQLGGEEIVLSFREIERGEPGHAADELAVDPHGASIASALTPSSPISYRPRLP